ncbi:MAG: hypothetical protein H6679_04625 [Epsilonproteobacteria bacterium]|nr:hypothetical protein [Campylobacterota bacterium]
MKLPEHEHEESLLDSLVSLPHKILCHHEIQGLPELVLHELGHDSCFGLNRSIYIVDNPDFDCSRGVAGYCKDDCKYHKQDPWQEPHAFHKDMCEAPFGKCVRSFNNKSFLRNHKDDNDHTLSPDEIDALCKAFDVKNPACFTWKQRHGNHGILIFDGGNDMRLEKRKKILANCSALLSLC